MSSKNTLPSVDLMSCQHGGEVIPSIAIERIISLRDEGIRVYLDGIDKLRKARDLMLRILAQREHLFWRNVNAISGFT